MIHEGVRTRFCDKAGKVMACHGGNHRYSESGAGFGEIGFLLLRAGPPKRRVAMGKPAEAHDDVAMPASPVALFFIQRLEQANRFILIGEVLGMSERQIHEQALDRAELQIQSLGDGGASNLARLGVGGKRLG